MKFSVLLVLFVCVQPCSSQDAGIRFSRDSYRVTLDRARNEHRPVFLYFHFDGCGACKKMEDSTFSDPDVAEYYNTTFVCLDINTEKEDGAETNKEYGVRMHPTFLYLDSEGSVVHTAVGVFTPTDFLKQARIALDPDQRLSALDKRYADGDRDAQFLLRYCYSLRDAYRLTPEHIRAYVATVRPEDLLTDVNMRFTYEFALHQYEIGIPFGSPAYMSMFENRDRFAKIFDSAQVVARLVWVAHMTAALAIEFRNEILLEKALAVIETLDRGSGHQFREMDGRLTGMFSPRPLGLSLRLWYYQITDDTLRYAALLPTYVEKIWNNSGALNDLAWSYYEKESARDRLEQAIPWIERSLALRRFYNNLDTYASLLYKLGRVSEAGTQAELAIECAKEEDEDYSSTAALLDTIRAALKTE
ncbi:MAG: thioredoxin fold domain-containing protein [Bacteroidia bacterium]|nr:thioredoxin fold domain-containing protein [Bacteroidia bacterium]